jgi:hypothetical protein
MKPEQRKLIIEHASLVAKHALENPGDNKDELTSRLLAIETELNMSPKQIASKALRIYKKQYS